MKEEDIKKLATLCRIDLTDRETQTLRGDMESILGYVSEIGAITSSDVRPTQSKTGFREVVAETHIPIVDTHHNVMREDGEAHASGLYTEDMLAAMPENEAGYLKVKQIL